MLLSRVPTARSTHQPNLFQSTSLCYAWAETGLSKQQSKSRERREPRGRDGGIEAFDLPPDQRACEVRPHRTLMAKRGETRPPCKRQSNDSFGMSVPFAGKVSDKGPKLSLATRSLMQGSRCPPRSDETISFPTSADACGQNGLRLRIMVQFSEPPSAGASLR